MATRQELSFVDEIARSEDYALPFNVRTAIRHDLITAAAETDEDEMWYDLALALIRATENDDLRPPLVDRFVSECPRAVFGVLPRANAAVIRFKTWRVATDEARDAA